MRTAASARNRFTWYDGQVQALSSEKLLKSNPNHDERGRFTTGSGVDIGTEMAAPNVRAARQLNERTQQYVATDSEKQHIAERDGREVS